MLIFFILWFNHLYQVIKSWPYPLQREKMGWTQTFRLLLILTIFCSTTQAFSLNLLLVGPFHSWFGTFYLYGKNSVLPHPRHLLLHHIWYFLVLLLLLTKTKAKNGQIVTFRIPPSSIFLIQFSTFQAIGVDLCAAGCCATGFPLHPLHCCIIENLFIGGVSKVSKNVTFNVLGLVWSTSASK